MREGQYGSRLRCKFQVWNVKYKHAYYLTASTLIFFKYTTHI